MSSRRKAKIASGRNKPLAQPSGAEHAEVRSAESAVTAKATATPRTPGKPVAPASGVLLGLDFGRVRHGLAICDAARILASPLTAIAARPQLAAIAAIAEMAKDQGAQAVVVGLPLSKDGGENAITREVRSFAGRLAQATRLPALFGDERYTTEEALELLRERGATVESVKGNKDAWAAAVILQDYLDSHRREA